MLSVSHSVGSVQTLGTVIEDTPLPPRVQWHAQMQRTQPQTLSSFGTPSSVSLSGVGSYCPAATTAGKVRPGITPLSMHLDRLHHRLNSPATARKFAATPPLRKSAEDQSIISASRTPQLWSRASYDNISSLSLDQSSPAAECSTGMSSGIEPTPEAQPRSAAQANPLFESIPAAGAMSGAESVAEDGSQGYGPISECANAALHRNEVPQSGKDDAGLSANALDTPSRYSENGPEFTSMEQSRSQAGPASSDSKAVTMQHQLDAALQQKGELKSALHRAAAAGQAARDEAARLREEANAAKAVSQEWCLQLNDALEQLKAARDEAKSLQDAQSAALIPHQGAHILCIIPCEISLDDKGL